MPRRWATCCAAAALHPAIGGLGVVDDLADRGIEAEEAIGQAQRLDRVLQGGHAADQVRPAAADHDVERRRPVRAEMLAQRVAHGAEGGEDVGVVRLAADDEQDVGLRQPVLEADPRHLLHLLVGRVAAEVGGDDRVVAQHLGDQRVRTAAEGRRQDRAVGIDDVDVALALMGAQLVDLGLEVRLVGSEQVVGQPQPLPARIVAVEAALEVAGDRRQPAARVRPHPDRVELEGVHAEIVDQLPQARQVLDQRRDDRAGCADVGQRVGDHERLQAGQRLERDVGDLVLAQLLDVDAAVMGDGDGGCPEPGRIRRWRNRPHGRPVPPPRRSHPGPWR